MKRKVLDLAILVRSSSKQKMLEKQPQRDPSGADIARLTCILMAIFLFVAIALATTLSMLGVMKTIYVWALLTSDINEEQQGMENKQHSNSNVQKLNKSLDKETMYSSICLILAGFGFQLCCACAVLLYGLFMNRVQAIYAWIIFSTTNTCCLAILIFFLVRFTKIPASKTLELCLESFMAIIFLFNLKLFYYSKCMNWKSQNIIVKAYGGFTHTVSPNQPPPEKDEGLSEYNLV